MNILWFTNVPTPEASTLGGIRYIPYGGWLDLSSRSLSAHPDVRLSIAFPHKCQVDTFSDRNQIKYVAFEPIVFRMPIDMKSVNSIRNIVTEISPDVVHIFGTEYAHTCACVFVCNEMNIPCIIDIQGLMTYIKNHMHSCLPEYVLKGRTIRNICFRDHVYGLIKKAELRSIFEIQAIENVHYVIGRTDWDKTCAFHINPKAKYYKCHRFLREPFYHHQWDIDQCERYSIFMSQGSVPYKGLHMAIKALAMIQRHFSGAKLYVAGPDIISSKSLKDRLLRTYYGSYISDLIHQCSPKSVVFVGQLDEMQICEAYQRSHVYISPSAIDNNSNSLSEAMILGVPSIASFVGGQPDMLSHGVDGLLYQYDAPYMLAKHIMDIYSNDELAKRFSYNARKRALERHNPEVLRDILITIYRNIRQNLTID